MNLLRCNINGSLVIITFLFSLHNTQAATQSSEYPGRSLYPDVNFIELNAFYEKLKNAEVNVVDVRSSYEYQTLRIKDAVNIPLASRKFISELRQLRKESNRPIVVYCNGKTCMKSYKAARKAADAKIQAVIAYDSGILDFAKAHPKQTLLLGKTLTNTSRLISKAQFNRHLMSPEEFDKRIANSSDILLDIRERVQRDDGISYFVGREHRVTLDNQRKLNRYIEKAKKENKALLVYDAAGKQVRWLQYYLESRSVKNYYFMDGGITAYYKSMEF